MINWKEFDKTVDFKGLNEDIKNAENGGDFEKTPHGVYEVTVKKMELKQSKKGDPMLAIQFMIVDGSCKGKYIFYNQVMVQGFGIVNAVRFLQSMDLDTAIEFTTYDEFNEMVLDAFEEILGNNLTFVMDYKENPKNPKFDMFEITETLEG